MERPLWQNILILIAAMLLMAWAANAYYFGDRIKKLDSLKQTLSSIETEIQAIAPSGMAVDNITTVNTEIEKRLTAISKKIPSEVDVPYIIETFIKESLKNLDVDYTFVQPKVLVQQPQYKVLPIHIEMMSDFGAFTLYLSRLEKLPVFVSIDNIDIVRNDPEKDLSIKLDISAYFFPGQTYYSNTNKLNLDQTPYIDPFYQSNFRQPVSYVVKKTSSRSGKKTRRKTSNLPTFRGVFRGEETKAFINNEVVGVGEYVNGYKIENIGKRAVVINKGGISHVIKIGR